MRYLQFQENSQAVLYFGHRCRANGAPSFAETLLGDRPHGFRHGIARGLQASLGFVDLNVQGNTLSLAGDRQHDHEISRTLIEPIGGDDQRLDGLPLVHDLGSDQDSHSTLRRAEVRRRSFLTPFQAITKGGLPSNPFGLFCFPRLGI